MIKRDAIRSLISWKGHETRKPLLILGARQVGKTYLIEHFAQQYFPRYHRFDFVENEELIPLFDGSLEPSSLLRRIATYTGVDIDPKKDLIFFDEIQHCPKAITALKYFEKHQPNSFVCGSGSLLGIKFADSPFPVGKIDRIDLAPLSFKEFLHAIGETQIANSIEQRDFESFANISVHNKTFEFFKYYLITGGLPEVVAFFIKNYAFINQAFEGVRALQYKLIKDYEDDFIKYAEKENAIHIRSVFRDVPLQLTKNSHGAGKFIFKGVVSGASTYRDLEGPIEWLDAARLIFKIPILANSESPLKAHFRKNLFKLYLFDVGLLCAMVGLTAQDIIKYNYGNYKGYVAENFVAQELLVNRDRTVVSWSKNSAEIEFLLEDNGKIIPIEVKAGINTKAKSLRVYTERFAPTRTILLTGNPLLEKERVAERLPIYLAGHI